MFIISGQRKRRYIKLPTLDEYDDCLGQDICPYTDEYDDTKDNLYKEKPLYKNIQGIKYEEIYGHCLSNFFRTSGTIIFYCEK
jgi:hypothetical protein